MAPLLHESHVACFEGDSVEDALQNGALPSPSEPLGRANQRWL